MSLQGLFAQHVELEIPSQEAPNVSTEGSVTKKRLSFIFCILRACFSHPHYVALEVNQVLSE